MQSLNHHIRYPQNVIFSNREINYPQNLLLLRYIDSPEWIKHKKVTINAKNKDDKYFQYTATVVLNYREIKWNPERVSNIEPFINNWDGIKCSSKQKIGKSSRVVVQQLLLICYMKKKWKYAPAYISKYNSTREKQLTLLMIPNVEKRRPAISCSKKNYLHYNNE